MKEPRRNRHATEWSEIVARWRASGETSKEFASRHGLNNGTLLWWSSRLSKQSAVTRRRAPGQKGSAFEEVMVTGVAMPSTTMRMEVVTRGGRVVRWEGSVDVGSLREVLQAVESC